MSGPRRLPARPTELIDRDAPLAVLLDGERLDGYAGDTVASLLAAHGKRSLRAGPDGRRRAGVVTADRLDRGLHVTWQGRGVVAAHALVEDGAVLGVASPGRAAAHATPELPATPGALRVERSRPDVLVIGGGGAGLAAALGAADLGAEVLLVEAERWTGGRACWTEGDDHRGLVQELAAAVAAHPGIELRVGATVVEATPHVITVAETVEDLEVLHVVRPLAVVVATGRRSRPLPFEGHDLAGVMAADGVRRLLHLWSVRPGNRAVVLCDTPRRAGADALAAELADAGVEVVSIAVVDGVAGRVVARGRHELEGVRLPSGSQLAADLLVTSFGVAVDVELIAGLGGVLSTLPDSRELAIGGLPPHVMLAGWLNGGGVQEARAAGRRAADAVAHRLRARPRVLPPPGPVVVAQSQPTVDRPVRGRLEATSEVQIEQLHGFTASTASATELLVMAARTPGAGSAARLVLADLARSTPHTASVAHLVLSAGSPDEGPSLAAVAELRRVPRRRSPLYDRHLDLGGRMITVGEWLDVADYGNVALERAALEEAAGIRDAARWGLYELAGIEADEVLDAVTEPGTAARFAAAGVLGALGERRTVAPMAPGRWLVRVHPDEVPDFEATVLDRTMDRPPWRAVAVPVADGRGRVLLRGPAAARIVGAVVGHRGAPAVRRSWVSGALAGVVWWLPDDHGVEVHVTAGLAPALWTRVLRAGRAERARPVGFEAAGEGGVR